VGPAHLETALRREFDKLGKAWPGLGLGSARLEPEMAGVVG